MRISQINQQMNTHRMNQNASVNRSNTTNMQNPSFGTTIHQFDKQCIIAWKDVCSSDFVKKHAQGLVKRFKELQRDGFSDVISFKRIKKYRYQNYGAGLTVCGEENEVFPKLHIKRNGLRDLVQAMSRTPILILGDSHGHNFFNLTEAFGKFLEDLTPKKVAEYRAKAVKRAGKPSVKRVAARRPKQEAAVEQAKKETKKNDILSGLRKFAGK